MRTCTGVYHLRYQFVAHRHCHFGRRRRRRRTHIRCKIDQRRVGLVADRRNQRDFGFRRSPNDNFLIESPKVLQTAAAARNDQ